MNAGAYGGEMKDVLVEATVLDTEGNVRTLKNEELELGYRHSIVKEKNYSCRRNSRTSGREAGNGISHKSCENKRISGVERSDRS